MMPFGGDRYQTIFLKYLLVFLNVSSVDIAKMLVSSKDS